MIPELSRRVALDRLPDTMMVEATAAELAAVAARLRIPQVRLLRCRFSLKRRGVVVDAEGVLDADVVQDCVVSLEPVQQRVTERFDLRFVPEGAEIADDDPESPDEIPYQGSSIDMGEAAVEQLGLALDPYPRHPDAMLEAVAADDDDDDSSGAKWASLLVPKR